MNHVLDYAKNKTIARILNSIAPTSWMKQYDNKRWEVVIVYIGMDANEYSHH